MRQHPLARISAALPALLAMQVACGWISNWKKVGQALLEAPFAIETGSVTSPVRSARPLS